MKIEFVSGNSFLIDLDGNECHHLLELTENRPERMLETLVLWFEIGFLTSQNLTERILRLCKSNESPNANSS